MDGSLFISRRLRNKGKVAMTVIAVSFLVMVIAVAVSSGFRKEIREGISTMSGDVQLTLPDMNYLDETSPASVSPACIGLVESMDEVAHVDSVIYRAGIVKHEEDIHGVLVKGISTGAAERIGVPVNDTIPLSVIIPSSMASVSGLRTGDRMLTYFVGEKVKARQFVVAGTYEPLVKTDDRYLVYADIQDMRRLNGWEEDEVSMFEVVLSEDHKDEDAMKAAADKIGYIIYGNAGEDDDVLVSTSVVSRFPQLFDWLGLIDFNVLFIILLMIIVAGFNMISGLLILLFENISTIGLLKSLGMKDRSIAKVFLSSSAVLVLKGMALGNILAMAFCYIQNATHFLKLNPENYFLSFVPCHLDMGMILLADAVSFAAIMIMLLIPSLFISRIDPSETMRVK